MYDVKAFSSKALVSTCAVLQDWTRAYMCLACHTAYVSRPKRQRKSTDVSSPSLAVRQSLPPPLPDGTLARMTRLPE